MLHRSLCLPSFCLCPRWDPSPYWQPQPSERYWKLFSLIKIQLDPAFPTVIRRCSLEVRMQQLLTKVLCSTLLLLAVVPTVYSQSGRAASFYYHITVLILHDSYYTMYLISPFLNPFTTINVACCPVFLTNWQEVKVWDVTENLPSFLWQWNLNWWDGLQ